MIGNARLIKKNAKNHIFLGSGRRPRLPGETWKDPGKDNERRIRKDPFSFIKFIN